MRRLIRASAGSGKTFQLSGHFLRQLFLGHKPETILATTFTRKAAGEILGRVLTRLAEAAEDPAAARNLGRSLQLNDVTCERSQNLLAEVTGQLHRLRVCTLDSFFQQIARSLTLELGLPPGWSIIDNHADQELREKAIDAVLSLHLPQDAQHLMHMLAKGRSKRSVRSLIDDTVSDFHELFLLTDDEAWDKLPKHSRLTQEQREQAIRDLYACPIPTDKRFIKARAEDVERFQAELWDDFIDKGIANKVLNDEESYYGKTLNHELIEIYQRLLSHVKAELLDRLTLQMKAIRNLITRYDREYSRLRSEHGWLRFGDVTRVLARSSEAASGRRMTFRLDSSIRNLLLDEFQDTSSDQWQILKRLTQSLDQHDDASFFCVGDGKQAIYGWRGGVAAILDAVERAVPKIIAESLDKSRRSSPAVMEAVNSIFRHVDRHGSMDDYQPECVKWAKEFPEHSTANEDMPGYVCLRTSPETDDDNPDQNRTPWFRWVAEQIRCLHLQSPGASVGVLTRRNSTVARLVHELSLVGVPASEEGGTPPTDSPAVLAMLSLLHMASHPACTVSRFHVAASPLGSLLGLHDWTDAAMATDVAARLRARLMDDGYGRTLQELSEAVAVHCSERDHLRLQQIVAAGWQFDQVSSLNPCEFVRLLENSKFQKSAAAPVRVMTIHQSKGLEFDVVVLAELDGQIFQNPQAAFTGPAPGETPDRVCVWTKKSMRPLLPASLQQAFDDTIARQVSESLCVLYVALTRAIHAMHLLIEPVKSDKLPKSYAGLLIASLSGGNQTPPSSTVYETGDPDWYQRVPKLQSAAVRSTAADSVSIQRIQLAPMQDGRRRGLRRRSPSQHDAMRLFLPAVSTAAAQGYFAPATRSRAAGPAQPPVDARTRGTVMHAWFECIEWLGATSAGPDEALLRERTAILSLPEPTINVLLREFEMLLKRPEIRDVFSKSNAGSAQVLLAHRAALDSGQAVLKVDRERTFVLLQSNTLVLGTIDRLVRVIQNGHTVAADIVDFKTDRRAGDRELWVEDRRSFYSPQLDEYRSAVSHCFGIPVSRISARLLLLEVASVFDI